MGVNPTAIFFLLVVSSCILDVASCQSQERVCMASGDDHDDHCDKYLKLDDLCLMRDKVLKSDMAVVFLEENYTLNCTIEVEDTANLSLEALKGSKTLIECSNSGFVFKNVSNVSISDLELRGCGSHYSFEKPIQYLNITQIVSALVFAGGADLTLSHVTISKARFCGLCLHNVAGNITVDSCNITNATSTNITSLGGNVIVYDSDMEPPANASVTVQHCHIINSGYRRYKKNCITKKQFSYSSGLSLFLGNRNLMITILDTQFLQNVGCNGGNMAILLFDLPSSFSKPMVTITDTQFEEGRALYGGGLYITFEASFDHHNFTTSSGSSYSEVIVISNCTFLNNSAETTAGGLFMQWNEITTDSNQIFDTSINNTVFDGNHLGRDGRGGLGLHYKNYIDFRNQPHKLLKLRVNLKMINCAFYNHTPILMENEPTSGSSVILAESVPYLEISGVTISSNNCTGILSIDSVIVFSGSSEISHNWALNGGGMRLCSGALLYFNPNTELLITGNTVEHNGGGILVNNKCLVNVPMCFYQYTYNISHNASPWKTVNVTITNNSARDAGDNIYGGSIDYCYLLYVKQSNRPDIKDLLNVPNNINVTPSSISSDAQRILLERPQSNEQDPCYTENKNFTIHPGESIKLFVRVVGQLCGAVSGIISAATDDSLVLQESDKAKNVPSFGKYKYYKIFSSKNEITNDSSNLYLHTDNEEVVPQHLIRNYSAVVRINFKPCPFGFHNVNQSGKFGCKCVQGFIKCSLNHKTIRKDKTKWVGVFSNNLASGHCPLDYCNPEVVDIPALEHSLDQDVQCRYNRTGIMCGSCPKGWSLVLGTSACSNECSNTWLLLIILFALMGLLLVAIIHFLNLTITTGTICGLIFYVNIVQDYSIVVLGEQPVPILTPLLQVFLAWFNLDLGIQICFYHGMSAFGKTLLQGVFPLYIWLISAVIVFLSNRYLSVTRFVGENAVKVLATLFLLSYSKMLRVTIGVLNFKTLYITSGSDGPTVPKVRWILDGNISYFSLQHSVLIILFVVLLVVILPFSFTLLCLRQVHSLSNYFPRAFSWINRLKPFFDAFTGPFKDNTRFWPGLLLFVRLLLLIVNIVDYSYYITLRFVVVIITCTFLLSIMTVCSGVYSKHILNILEVFFVLNLNLIALAHIAGTEQIQMIVGHAAVCSALVAFVGITAYHVYLKCNGYRIRREPWQQDSFDVRSWEGLRDYRAHDKSLSLMAE